jgi:hypothetical protein
MKLIKAADSPEIEHLLTVVEHNTRSVPLCSKCLKTHKPFEVISGKRAPDLISTGTRWSSFMISRSTSLPWESRKKYVSGLIPRFKAPLIMSAISRFSYRLPRNGAACLFLGVKTREEGGKADIGKIYFRRFDHPFAGLLIVWASC